MPKQIVIDTNILVYLENEGYQHHVCCCDCINLMEQSDFHLCFDEGFNIDESKNKSFVWHEYKKHLPHGSSGYAFVLALLSANRLSFVSKSPPLHINKKINQSGIKKSDRIFVRIAYRTNQKKLISDEHEDFTIAKRSYFSNEIGVEIIHSWEVVQDFFT